MKKLLILLAFLIAALLIPQKIDATTVSESSAVLSNLTPVVDKSSDLRTKAVRNVFLKYNSPLADYARFYVTYADEYGVDWKLLPAISGLESSFGLRLMPRSYNGYGWGGGHIYFESWEDGIRTINKALKERYMARGATDVWSIGKIYAESPTWAIRVNGFMEQINQEHRRLTIFAVVPTI